MYPAHFVALDLKNSLLIVSIRGTFSLKDTFADLAADSQPFEVQTFKVFPYKNSLLALKVLLILAFVNVLLIYCVYLMQFYAQQKKYTYIFVAA